MCYSLRELNREPERAGQEPVPPSTTRLPFTRPRVAGAIAAVIVAMVAAAALLVPSSTPAVSDTKAAAPAGPVIEQTSTTVDDGVPSSTDVARSGAVGARHCDHEL